MYLHVESDLSLLHAALSSLSYVFPVSRTCITIFEMYDWRTLKNILDDDTQFPGYSHTPVHASAGLSAALSRIPTTNNEDARVISGCLSIKGLTVFPLAVIFSRIRSANVFDLAL
ncbi:hypothetical protein PAXRUDRAFT_311832 [Paxillus rubicundulus Ve08.2h10]|uniref:Uncharacterized protein n=1 Tax=Paxillus rubicundulus Ve08.2h10 TaxID=930991 RepID=A0A0D0DZZ4_9AGAM|nr:hypothetical protein PAXRUDRAFT_311832 [Paxillus rubicundulus Ve08.2h10]